MLFDSNTVENTEQYYPSTHKHFLHMKYVRMW